MKMYHDYMYKKPKQTKQTNKQQQKKTGHVDEMKNLS